METNQAGNEAHKVTKPRIFKIQQSELLEMFDSGALKEIRLTKLRELGYAQNILVGINSEATTGIVGDRGDLLRRKAVYGENVKPLPTPSKIWESFKQEAKNLLWVIIGATAIIGGFCAIYAEGFKAAMLEAIFLLMFAFMMILLNALVDYCKDKKFIQLRSLLIDDYITVTRGKFGATEQISVWEVVVGDILTVSQGQRIPADCIVIESADFHVDENADSKFKLQVDEEGKPIQKDVQLEYVAKAPYYNENNMTDPFVRADALVTNGNAKLLVCCTGEKSTRGVTQSKLEDDSVNTKLQTTLKNLGSQFTNYSLIACFIIFIVLITMSFVRASVDVGATTKNGKDASQDTSTAGILIEALPKTVNLIVVLVVVAIPEGLPLTIQISLAFSVMRMYKLDRILLRKQESLEKIAEANEFVIGKTNILTSGKMKVKQFYLEGVTKLSTRDDTFLRCELQQNTIKLVQEGILYNNSAYVQMGETKFVPVGDNTEVGLLKFLQNADIPIHTEILRRYDSNIVIASVPLRTKSAGMFYTACAVNEGNNMVSIHIKGAPAAILPLASHICGDAGNAYVLDDDSRAAFIREVEKMAACPLRVIALAHGSISRNTWEQLLSNREGSSANEVLAAALHPDNGLEIKIVGALGLQDKIRPMSKSALAHACGPPDEPRITVRMVSGDAKETCVAVALQCGLLTEAQVKDHKNGQDSDKYTIMTATEFDEVTQRGENTAMVTRVLNDLRVLAKATPEHRYNVIKGLQEHFDDENKKVAATGRSISDVDALHRADVSLAMGSGCSAAKEVSDMVLTGDDFEAVVKAIMWGRNIYHNVARFLQFQVTVNLSCLLTMFVAPMFLGESPFSAVQLLWLNIVMDTLAAFALGTEPPLPTVINGKPYNDQQVMRPEIWRQILGMTFWNFFVMLVILIFAPLTIAHMTYHMPDSAARGIVGAIHDTDANGEYGNELGRCTAKLRHCTWLFHVFLFMQYFNLINCRKDGPKEYNVFGKPLHNIYFLIVLGSYFAFQFLAPATFIRTAGLNKREWGACLMVGATPLLVSALLKCTPVKWLGKLKGGPCGIVDEKKEAKNKLTAAFDSLSKKTVGAQEEDDGYKDAEKEK